MERLAGPDVGSWEKTTMHQHALCSVGIVCAFMLLPGCGALPGDESGLGRSESGSEGNLWLSRAKL